ncbi:tetratricopeptide repeat domain-containing protein [Ditylenchus destructor]|nr:tetratricopeptide repeat domain-containing protein [Ditylenchus destructor]
MLEQALKEKNLGNEAYKKKDFVTAHAHYDKAIGADPTNMTFYNNKAAAFFEEGKYEECIARCSEAIGVGREHRADFATVAKAYARMANAYVKLGQVKEALLSYEKSLSEHRDPDVVKKHKQLEKEIKEKEKLAYIDPEVSNEEKNKGNDFFKKGDYPNAMKHYNEAIKRNPDNPVLYSNRAACYTKFMEVQRFVDNCDICLKNDPNFRDCPNAMKHYNEAIKRNPDNPVLYSNRAAYYTKLMQFQRAVDDCDICLKKDPNFIKAYIQKGAALQAMREFSRAQRSYEDVLTVDSSNGEALEGLRTCYRSNDEDPEKARERALQDPEVQEILRDPTMRLVLDEEKNKGNELFKKGDYPNAMKHYNEAIKRNPDNPVLYSNRAACYTKLMEFQRAVDDCDICLKKDPNFIKAYIQKGAALQAMREFSRAQISYKDALTVDSSNGEALEGLRTCYRSNDEDPEKARERALQDPEVQKILYNFILEQVVNKKEENCVLM